MIETQKTINEMPKKYFQELEIKYDKKGFTSFIICPMKEIHDSGYRCMKFILLRRHKIVGTVSGWSDVVHFNGIGGQGKNGVYEKFPRQTAYRIDCLRKSGLVRVIADYLLEVDEPILSDFIFYLKEDLRGKNK